MLWGQRRRRPKAYVDGATTGQPLETILMKRTAARSGITWFTCQEHMPHLRMHQPVEWMSMNDGAATDAGTDGQVHYRIAASSRPVYGLRHRCRVDVGVDGHRHS